MNFSFVNSSWTIISGIEASIKSKIMKLGKRLVDWDISIYRGILTGYNEAFIVDSQKKEALINEDPKSAEIIRPILRGRDIKKYSFSYADLWLIALFPSKHYDIEDKLPVLFFAFSPVSGLISASRFSKILPSISGSIDNSISYEVFSSTVKLY